MPSQNPRGEFILSFVYDIEHKIKIGFHDGLTEPSFFFKRLTSSLFLLSTGLLLKLFQR